MSSQEEFVMYTGQLFSNWDQFDQLIQKYLAKEKRCKLTSADSHMYQIDTKNAKKFPNTYSYKHLKCERFGKSKSLQSKKTNCPFSIRANHNPFKNIIEIKDLFLQHNHLLSIDDEPNPIDPAQGGVNAYLNVALMNDQEGVPPGGPGNGEQDGEETQESPKPEDKNGADKAEEMKDKKVKEGTGFEEKQEETENEKQDEIEEKEEEKMHGADSQQEITGSQFDKDSNNLLKEVDPKVQQPNIQLEREKLIQEYGQSEDKNEADKADEIKEKKQEENENEKKVEIEEKEEEKMHGADSQEMTGRQFDEDSNNLLEEADAKVQQPNSQLEREKIIEENERENSEPLREEPKKRRGRPKKSEQTSTSKAAVRIPAAEDTATKTGAQEKGKPGTKRAKRNSSVASSKPSSPKRRSLRNAPQKRHSG